ncbi:hypothetical protein D7030_02715 [Flavobacteriaceae bacterium AU392]|nr:hypothetical protein D1817_09190 [Flavobacteriaceae bacterium]RKM85602.1 hypothetical protein D7030_02715 [Flavobacteriaceae bacterium AU392]
MKKIILLFLITISCINYQLYAFQQQGTTILEIYNGKIDRIYSEILGEERPIWIHIPKDTSKKPGTLSS